MIKCWGGMGSNMSPMDERLKVKHQQSKFGKPKNRLMNSSDSPLEPQKLQQCVHLSWITIILLTTVFSPGELKLKQSVGK
jgi:hypothetical protein